MEVAVPLPWLPPLDTNGAEAKAGLALAEHSRLPECAPMSPVSCQVPGWHPDWGLTLEDVARTGTAIQVGSPRAMRENVAGPATREQVMGKFCLSPD